MMNYTFDRMDDNLALYLPLKGFSTEASDFFRPIEDVEILFKKTENVDIPSPAQKQALDYLVNNSEHVIQAVCDFINGQREKLEGLYGTPGDDPEVGFPNFKTPEELLQLANLETIYIHEHEREGYAYMGILGNCVWDIEHGTGIVMHKDRGILVGHISDALSGRPEIFKDKGTFAERQERVKAIEKKYKRKSKKWWRFW